MPKNSNDSINNNKSQDNVLAENPPELKLDISQIDSLIMPEARIEAYNELFMNYLEAMQKESSVGRQRYYGYHLENLMDQISNDKLIGDFSKSKKIYCLE